MVRVEMLKGKAYGNGFLATGKVYDVPRGHAEDWQETGAARIVPSTVKASLPSSKPQEEAPAEPVEAPSPEPDLEADVDLEDVPSPPGPGADVGELQAFCVDVGIETKASTVPGLRAAIKRWLAE